jgi:DNA-binding NarL/FixJ family response regulator
MRARDLRAAGFLSKPVSADVLLAAIEAATAT